MVPRRLPDPVAQASENVRRALKGAKRLRRFLGALCRAVDAAGGSVWLVGGFVRDLAEGRPGKDIDLMVAGISDATLGALLRSLPGTSLGLRRIASVGKQFPVYKVGTDWSGEDIDVALARSGRRGLLGGRTPAGPLRRPGAAARDDVSRRDFTINSLLFALRPEGRGFAGEIVDFFGGAEDLRQGIIRGVGDPGERFREDPVRILRAVRFRNERPGFAIEPRTRVAIRRAAPRLLGSVAGDRLAGELVRSLAANPGGTVEDLERLGLLWLLVPELGRGRLRAAALMKRRYSLLEKKLGRPLPAPVLLAAFLLEAAASGGTRAPAARRPAPTPRDRGGGAPPRRRLSGAEAAARRLHLPQVRRTVRMIEDLRRLEVARRGPHPHARIERIFSRWPDPGQLMALYEASRRASGRRAEDFRPLLRRAARRPPLLSGADVIGLGAPQGPMVDRIVEAVREATLTGEIGSREEALRMAGACLARGGSPVRSAGGRGKGPAGGPGAGTRG